MEISVYALTFPDGKQYIGVSNNSERRLRKHANPRYLNHLAVAQAIQEYGIEFVSLEIIKTFLNRTEAYEHEIKCIAELDTLIPNGYNMVPGGNGSFDHSSKAKERRGKKLSRTSKKMWANRSPEERVVVGRKISRGVKEYEANLSLEEKRARRNAQKRRWINTSSKKKIAHAKVIKEHWINASPEEKEARTRGWIKAAREWWLNASPEEIAEHARKTGEAARKRLTDPAVRKRMSEASKKALADPAVRKRISEGTKRGLRLKRQKQDATL